MTKFHKIAGICVIAGIVVGLLFTAVSKNEPSLSGIYHNTTEYFIQGLKAGTSNQFVVSESGVISSSGGITIGASGTALTQVLKGTCNAATTALPLAATTTITFTCSATGVASGDNVSIVLPHLTGVRGPAGFGSLVVSGVVASTNTISFGITNLTGVSTSSFPLATTSVQYRAFR